NGQSGTGSSVINSDGGSTLNLPNNAGNAFIKLTAPTSPTTPSTGGTCKDWSTGSGSDNPITTTTSTSICVRNPGGSQNDIYVATYRETAVTTTTALARTTGSASNTYGNPLTFTATVTGSTNPSSVGSVTFRDGTTTICTTALSGNT